MSPRDNNGHAGPNSQLRGFMFVGALVEWAFSEPQPGDTRPPLGNVKVQGSRPDGEPFWGRFWFRAEQVDLVAALKALGEGEMVVVGFRNVEGRSGRTSQQAVFAQPWSAVPVLEAVPA